MNAGLPGTGIGGLFYIASALFMPLHRMARGQGHDGRGWGRVLMQAGIGAGILGALFATGLVLALLFAPTPVLQPDGSMAVAGAPSLFRWVVVLGTLGILTLVVVGVEVLAVTLRVRRRRVAVRRLRVARRRRALPEPELREVA